jgi:hypothetical protein
MASVKNLELIFYLLKRSMCNALSLILADTVFFIKLLLGAQTFSRETRSTPVHDMVQAEAGNGVRIPEFNPVDRSEHCFIEALF